MAFEGPLRLRNACDTCHQLKRKCSGTMPCENCALSNSHSLCFYSPTNRLGRPRGSKNRRKLSACSSSGSSQTRTSGPQRHPQQLAAPMATTQGPSQILQRRQNDGKWPGRLEFGAASGQGVDGSDWDQMDLEMPGLDLDGSLTVNSSQASGPLQSPPEPLDQSVYGTGRGYFLDHDVFAALNDLKHTTASHSAFSSLASNSQAHVNSNSAISTNSLLSTNVSTSTSENQYGEEDVGLSSPTYSPISNSAFGGLSHEPLIQENQQSLPAPPARTLGSKRATTTTNNNKNNNNNNSTNNTARPRSRPLSSCQCTPGLRNLLASLNAGSSSSSSVPQGEQQPYPVDTVLCNVALALEQWATLATCPRCSTSEEQQVEGVYLLAVMSVRCVLGQLRGFSPSPSTSSSPISAAREVDASRRGSTTVRRGDDTRKRRRTGECPPSPPVSHHADQQLPYDDPPVRVGSFDVTGPDRAMVLGVLRTVTARKMEAAVGAMREALRGKMHDDLDGRGSLLAHIDVMFEDLALAIRTLQ